MRGPVRGRSGPSVAAIAIVAAVTVTVAAAPASGAPARPAAASTVVAHPAIPPAGGAAIVLVPAGEWRDAAPAHAHGKTSWLAWGGHGELRLGHDRTRGAANPEWFSIGRVNGFLGVQPSRRWTLAGEGTYDHATDDFVMERIELAYAWTATRRLHAGVFPIPVGAVNLSHDAPRNDFAEHSLVATQLVGVPNAMLGAGVKGALGGSRRKTYELDLVTGFDDGLLRDASGGTRLPAGRSNFGDNNGLPALSARLAFRGDHGSAWGVGGISGPYNTTSIGGISVDRSRWVHLIVADGTTRFAGFRIAGEGGVAFIDVPDGLLGLYAEDQWGGSVEASRPIWDPLFGSWKRTALRGAVRADAVDLDRGIAGDSRHRVSASLNLHRDPGAVARLGWYYEIQRDRFNNPTPKAGITFTAATYF